MTGTEGARKLLAGELVDRLPTRIAELRARLGVSEAELPAPASIVTPDRARIEADDWPCVMVASNGAPRLRRVGIDELDGDGSTSYLRAYSLRVWVYVRAETFEGVADLRDRYTLAVVETLLSHQSLDDGRAVVDETSLSQSDSDLMPDSAGRSVGGAYVDVELRVVESLTFPYDPPPAPIVDGIEVVGSPLT